MPARRSHLARPAGLQVPPRRFVIVFALAVTVTFIILVSSSTRVQEAAPAVGRVSHSITEHTYHAIDIIPKPSIPKLYNPLAEAIHEPPDQENSNRGDVRWYNDLKWLNPFSSSVTLNNDRAVLPPLAPRTPIYTYYEGSKDKKQSIVSAENELILTWRRAWWAHGFRPVVLSRAEALKHPLHDRMSSLGLEASLIKDVERWLAWAHMGGGIMANWLALPMGAYDDELFTFLRNEPIEGMLKFKDQRDGLFAGGKEAVNSVLRQLFDDGNLKQTKDVLSILPPKSFTLDSRDASIAYYDMPTITKLYPDVIEELAKSQGDGLKALRQLVNAHLHNTWTSTFSEGIAVLKPFPKHTNILTVQALKIAHILAACPETSLPARCPPNKLHCTPCDAENPTPISTPETFANRSSIFTIGTVPHPVTFASLHYNRDDLDTRFVRRKTTRDLWLHGATEQMLGKILSGPQRLVRFKSAVASDFGAAHSFWMTNERSDFGGLDWIFGFEVASKRISDEDVLQPVKLAAGPDGLDGSEPSQRPTDRDGNMRPTDAELMRERSLIDHARSTMKGRHREDKPTVDRVEAWNMADTEAWRFVKAFGMRRQVEREQWEKQEKNFMGSRSRGGFGAGFLG